MLRTSKNVIRKTKILHNIIPPRRGHKHTYYSKFPHWLWFTLKRNIVLQYDLIDNNFHINKIDVQLKCCYEINIIPVNLYTKTTSHTDQHNPIEPEKTKCSPSRDNVEKQM